MNVATKVDPTKPQSIEALKPAPFTITPIKQEHRYFKGLIYGKFGTGKTSLACSSVDVKGMDDVIMVNAESGTMSVEHAEHIINREYIDQVRCTDFKTVANVQDFLTAHCAARDANKIKTLKLLQSRTFGYPVDIIDEEADDDVWEPLADDDPQESEFNKIIIRANPDTGDLEKITKARLRRYRTVIVDSLSEIDTFSMYQLLGIKTDMKLDQDVEVAEWTEFRKNNQLMQLLIRAYRDLKMHVIMITGEKYSQDEKKVFHYGPTLTGQLAYQIQGFVDIVGYLTNGVPKEGSTDIPRRLYVQPIGRFDAKSRIASYKSPYFDDPTMNKIMAAFRKVAPSK